MSSTSTTWATDANTKATATTSVNDTFLRGYLPLITRSSFSDNEGDDVFIPLYGDILTEHTSSANSMSNRLHMPYDGYLDKIVFRAKTTADTVDFEIYKAASGTDGDDADQNKLDATVSGEDDTAHTTITASFGTNYFFAAGDIMAIKMTYESNPGDIEMSIIWKILVD